MKKVALVTGASSGIGEDTAMRLKEAGYTVYAGARRVERMKGLGERGAKVVKLDVTDEDSMKECVGRIIEEQGRIDVLVNNAGYGSYGALEDVSPEEARRQFDVCVFGLARLTQLALPYMRKQRSGKIVNVSSVGGVGWSPYAAWYGSAKYAVEGLSNCLRIELMQFGIDVIVIQPGAIKTEWSGIARESMLRTSGDTAYGEQVIKQAKLLAGQDDNGSKPEVIGKTILKAVTARKPKTRYIAGQNAKLAVLLAKLPDRMYDRMYLSLIK